MITVIVMGILIISLYSFIILAFAKGWVNLQFFSTGGPRKFNTFVTIVVPFRNESAHLAALLNSLTNQDYPAGHFEIILVDDHSEDNSFTELEQLMEGYHNIRLLKLEKGSGKKSALYKGIVEAKGELIVTTDADCTAGEKWLSTIVAFYEIYRPKMIIAPVSLFSPKNCFQFLQSIEFTSLQASTAGSAGLSHPIMCNGSNLAFEKKAYFENNNFSVASASGDDMFFLHQLKKNQAQNIRYLKSIDAVVYTEACPNLRSFLNQRKRWASKSQYYKDFDTIATALIVATTNIFLAALFISGFFSIKYFSVFFFYFVLKCLSDFFLLHRTKTFWQTKMPLLWFIPSAFIYPWYIAYTCLTAVTGKYEWKNRKLT